MPDPYEAGFSAEAVTATETVFRALREEIAAGKLPPGARLVHRKLAQRLGTSTFPVIDALRRLEGAGLLVTAPGIGTHVKAWQPQEIREIYLIRAAHEGVACRLFAERATAVDVSVLETYHAEFDTAVRAGAAEEAAAVDERLHLHIVRAARSAELHRLVENSAFILLTIRNTMLPAGLAASTVAGRLGAHEPLVRALTSRDPDAAEREGRAHVLDAFERVRERLERFHAQRRDVTSEG